MTTSSAKIGLQVFAIVLAAWLGALPARADQIGYNRDIRPILSDKCFACHGPDDEDREAGLRLDVRQDAVDAGALEPGDPDASLLIERIASDDADVVMPPPSAGKPLRASEKQLLREWVAQGASYQRHWALEPVRQAVVPIVSDPAWCRTPVDRFILERLDARGLKPSDEADRYTLIRRVYLDLIGLLPSPSEVDAFVQDGSADAYERVVDGLLASQHYGERWGRHWLDQARYADSNGYTFDNERQMWPYRDWVINALNADVPFDQFTIEQLAGDLLPDATTDQLIATGFHRNTLINEEGGTDHEQFRVESVIDRTNTTGSVWLALTVGCAQCHHHKFDPIRQEDYYALYAFFNSTEDKNNVGPQVIVQDPYADRISEIDTQLAGLRDAGQVPPAPDTAQASIQMLLKEQAGLEAKRVRSMVMRELGERRPTHVLIRGDFLRPGQPVQPQPLADVHPAAGISPNPNRLDLARWLVDSEHPLTPRVAVNRAWEKYFGSGIVETVEDFGSQGSVPTHPELLDWLARHFVSSGWSLKQLHRLIVTSAVYRQSSARRDELQAVDPMNQLLGRQNRLRVDAEIVRDLALCAAGHLTRQVGGAPVFPPQPAGVYDFTQKKKDWITSEGADRYRRTLYTFFYRSAPHPLLSTFDAPRFNVTCTRRGRSNTPLQSLMIANDAGLHELAEGLAERVIGQGDCDAERIELAFRLCLCRPPDDQEVAFLAEFLREQQDKFRTVGPAECADPVRAGWIATSRVLMNLDEFITRE
jgi:hypothetical protein